MGLNLSEHPQEAALGECGRDRVGALYTQHAVGLIRAAMLLVGDQASAEDVVQDAFLGLYRVWADLRDHDKAIRYLRVAVLNGSRSVLRGRRRARLIGALQHDPPVWSAESAAMAREDMREVLAAVARLPRRQREVLVCKYYLDLPEQEIATTLRISRGTVASTKSRALAALIADLQEEK
ncbi:MAG TPA: sigma-70 family RNA polymerase sigma factor [Streptosporangiaceae bacterium]|jgi:RNA polymerase sigma-70 factor (sigma-E family)